MLPDWVVERCDRAKIKAFCHGARHEQLTAADLAEFLRIIEERGLRIVPREATERMVSGWSLEPEYLRACWRRLIDRAPPLAELLESEE